MIVFQNGQLFSLLNSLQINIEEILVNSNYQRKEHSMRMELNKIYEQWFCQELF